VFFGITIASMTSGSWCLDNVTLQLLTTGAGLQFPAGGVAGGQTVGTDPLGNVTVLDNAIKTQHIANNAITAAQTQLAAISSLTGTLATGAAVANIGGGTLPPGTLAAPNGVFTALAVLNATVVDQITTQSMVLTKGISLITLNSGPYAVAVTNTSNGDIVDLTNGQVYCTALTSGGWEDSSTLNPGLLTIASLQAAGSGQWFVQLNASGSGSSLLLDTGSFIFSANNVKLQASTAGSWFGASCSALDPSAPLGSFTYLTTASPNPGYWVMTATLHTAGAPAGWYCTLPD
jgi:hypothetical protein